MISDSDTFYRLGPQSYAVPCCYRKFGRDLGDNNLDIRKTGIKLHMYLLMKQNLTKISHLE